MTSSRYAYLFAEIAGLLIAYTFTSPFVDWKVFLNKSILKKIALLFMFWIFIDQIAINLSIWKFPEANSLNILFLRLPVEEYMIFILHSIYCVLFLKMYKIK